MCRHLCGLHITARTAILLAVLIGLAFSCLAGSWGWGACRCGSRYPTRHKTHRRPLQLEAELGVLKQNDFLGENYSRDGGRPFCPSTRTQSWENRALRTRSTVGGWRRGGGSGGFTASVWGRAEGCWRQDSRYVTYLMVVWNIELQEKSH